MSPRHRRLVDGDEAVPPAAHEELVVEDFPFLLDHDPDQQSGTGARSRMPMALIGTRSDSLEGVVRTRR